MSPYSQTLATARLDALEALVQALKDAETPDEKRRCAVAIFNAPEPCELDDTVEYEDDEENNDDASECDPEIAPIASASGAPTAASGQPVLACNTTPTPPAPPMSLDEHPFSSVERMNSILQLAGLPPVTSEEAAPFLRSHRPSSSA